MQSLQSQSLRQPKPLRTAPANQGWPVATCRSRGGTQRALPPPLPALLELFRRPWDPQLRQLLATSSGGASPPPHGVAPWGWWGNLQHPLPSSPHRTSRPHLRLMPRSQSAPTPSWPAGLPPQVLPFAPPPSWTCATLIPWWFAFSFQIRVGFPLWLGFNQFLWRSLPAIPSPPCQ